MELPQGFLSEMKDLLGDDYADFVSSFDSSYKSGLRINHLKISADEFERVAPYSIKKIPFVPGAYYVDDNDGWSKHPYYHAGLYYLQEPSAMLPASILPVEEDDIVLDLCAAPGGKSTQLIQKHPRLLISNDISFSRTLPLVKNMEHQGFVDYVATCDDPGRLASGLGNMFDKILVDAPCSGEGMFRRDKTLAVSYLQKGPEHYAPIQEEILDSAYKMLKCGGMILYSTCTYSDKEDEQVIGHFLDRHKDIRLADIKKEHGLSGPYEKYSNDVRLRGCVHAFPHLFEGEGHFVALMKKDGAEDVKSVRPIRNDRGKITDIGGLPDSANDFLHHLSDEAYERFANGRYLIADEGMIFLLPKAFTDIYDRSIRYVRTGLCVGNINRAGRFSPHTALALSLGRGDFDNTISFDAGDERVIRYLKGETIVLGPDDAGQGATDGYVMICVDSFPLGFGFLRDLKIKNMYEKGWIYR